jgi:hypothetical protein
VQRFRAVRVLNGIRVQVLVWVLAQMLAWVLVLMLAWVLALMLALEVGVGRLDAFQVDRHFATYVVPIRIY